MRLARRLCSALMLALLVPAAFAQTPPAQRADDLDVTMRVIVDPNAKVPDEIVRRIQLPKPAQPATSPGNSTEQGKSDDAGKPGEKEKSGGKGKPANSGPPGQQRAAESREQGREFGEQVSDEAKQRSEEARRNQKPPGKPPDTGPPRPPPGHQSPPPPPHGN